MSYEFYKVLHLLGVFLVLMSLTGVLAVRMTTETLPPLAKRLFFAGHGIGLVIALVGGFGLAARLNYMAQLPTWVWFKLLIWLLLGAGLTVAKRKSGMTATLYFAFLALGVTAAFLAVNKPGM